MTTLLNSPQRESSTAYQDTGDRPVELSPGELIFQRVETQEQLVNATDYPIATASVVAADWKMVWARLLSPVVACYRLLSGPPTTQRNRLEPAIIREARVAKYAAITGLNRGPF